MSDFKCNNCAKFKGNCGNHFKDSNGHIVWDCPSESMYDGVIGDIPSCFDPSTEFQKRINMENAVEIAKYPVEVIKMALELKEQQRRL